MASTIEELPEEGETVAYNEEHGLEPGKSKKTLFEQSKGQQVEELRRRT